MYTPYFSGPNPRVNTMELTMLKGKRRALLNSAQEKPETNLLAIEVFSDFNIST
jgi:tRNA G46 methylase TrmB